MLFAGAKQLADFQDPAYAGEYLDRVAKIYELDRAQGGAGKNFALSAAAAKYLAIAMAYDDVIRVADLKTRAYAVRPRAAGKFCGQRSDRLHHRVHASAA